MAQLHRLGQPVTRGEVRMLSYLQDRLPPDWIVFGNVSITQSLMTREIDAIVIGERCVWAIDEKSFGGKITGDEHYWKLADGYVRERVLDPILHAASIVKGKLRGRCSDLSEVWVEGLVLLSSSDVDLQVADDRVTRHVKTLEGAASYFLTTTLGKPLTSLQRESILRVLAGSEVTRRIVGASRARTKLPLCLKLTGANNFKRVYYSDETASVALTRNELRGALPIAGWLPGSASITLTFTQEGVRLAVKEGTHAARVNNVTVAPGETTILTPGTSSLELDTVALTTTIELLQELSDHAS